MAYSETLAARIRAFLGDRRGLTEKKMFGGMAFFLNGNMCCGVLRDEIVLKVGKDRDEELLKRKGCRPFDFTGKPMRGMVMVAESAVPDEDAIADWIEPALQAAAAKPPKKPKPARTMEKEPRKPGKNKR